MQHVLVNRVNLHRDSLSFAEAHVQGQWRLHFAFDADVAGQACVYIGHGGPTVLREATSASALPSGTSPPVQWKFEAGLHQICPRPLSADLRQFARSYYSAVCDLERVVMPSVPRTPSAPSTPASSPLPGADPTENTLGLEPASELEPEPEPDSCANSDSRFCTVVIHLECNDVDGLTQSQTTGLLVEVKSGSVDLYGTQLPIIHQVKQTLFKGGRMFEMVDVYGLESSVMISSPLGDPLQHNSLVESNVAGNEACRPYGMLDATASTVQPAVRYRISAGVDPGMCVICLCEAQDCVLLPCRHLCCCSACAQALHDAAMPRKPITVVAAAATAANEPMIGRVAMLSVFSRLGRDVARQHNTLSPEPARCPVCRDSIENVMQLSLPGQDKTVLAGSSRMSLAHAA